MLYIMESQLASLLLKPRRPISCLCMSGCGPHPRHHTEARSTRTPTHGHQTTWTGRRREPCRRRDAITERERERDRERGGGVQASLELFSTSLGRFSRTRRRQRNATRTGTFTGNRQRCPPHCKSNLPSVFPPCTENTLSANHSHPLSTHVFHQGAEFSAKIFAIRFHVLLLPFC